MSVPAFNLPDLVTLTRMAAVSNVFDSAVTPVAINFSGRVYPPSEPGDPGDTDAAPRAWRNPHLLWYKPGQLASAIKAGDRFDSKGVSWEALSATHGKRAGLQVLVNEVRCLPVNLMYPITAQLQNIGGLAIQQVAIAAWQTAEAASDRGSYKDLSAEASVDLHVALAVANRQLRFGNRTYRISDVVIVTNQPYVRMTLRSVS